MKKILSLITSAAVLAVMIASLGACSGGSSGKVKYIDIKLTDEQYAFAVNPSDTELLDAANELLAEIQQDGTFDKIVNKYFNNEGEPTGYEAGVQDSSKDQLVVATNTPFSPFEYKEGNLFYGVDIEIAAMLAEKLGQELVIVDMEFDAILTAVNTGNADIGMAGLTVSPDREELVAFTEPYYEASQVVIVREEDDTFDSCKTAEDVEAILSDYDSSVKIGVQTGTTGQLYVEGDEDWDFDGFDATCVGYESAASAVNDMLNGNLSLVVVDEAPAMNIVEAING